MSEHHIYPVKPHIAQTAHIDAASYQTLYRLSIENPETFWAGQANDFLDWQQPWQTVMQCDFAHGDIRWFQGGKLNVTYNCLDRHLATRGDQTAILWEGDDPLHDRRISYRELHRQVCQFANVLRSHGVEKGDRICIYLPMILEAAVVILACARIGAVHSIVFGGFSADALRDRILDADCRLLICAGHGKRGGKTVPSKLNADKAAAQCPNLQTVIVIRDPDEALPWAKDRDVCYQTAMQSASEHCPPVWMDAEDPLFILYTSGSTGKPKGLLHTTGGYLLYAAMTHKYIFDYHDGDIYWCTADIGWITGHSYVLYGPLCNGATTLMFEGVPTYPAADRFWQIVDKHQINIFYTAPTAIRALMAQGDDFVNRTDRSSLRILGSVGEPINPEAWEWYYRVVGDKRCPIVDTWWQTETGGILITPLPGATALKPGSASLPFFGIQPAIVDNDGHILDGEAEGVLVFPHSWPGQARTIYGDHARFLDTYFRKFPGFYFAGDGARRDADGYYWITGRVDDVINVSGHRLGTAEIESALVLHHDVAEAAVVGCPHAIKGQGIYAYVTLNIGVTPSDDLKKALRELIREEIGPIALPDHIQWAPGLPKTRSGKIMRRILRKIAANDVADLGDTSTLADPSVVADLLAQRAHQ
ncbi:MAG: acetate--CoA ligase [Methylomonas sp.]|nr:acetate--CoA ligase [Methylomonas sp.]PPD22137.1 MAG: acetate--CoA ligase [Methylomonas sp.]PPD25533.1 MAG: acetate--CoA ligase [Methylomonas sp.]PPD36325.1 MAG: acetate--CoA ligase [Methylomonas sp.]PPD40974.1 MAG: acetate--CoA ligase [Methylomonas sp.]